MTQSKKSKPAGEKPQYVVDLEGPYGPPSQEGFGAAVFFEVADAGDDLAALALKYYRYFVGDLWARWGEEVWMGPWKEVYTRAEGGPSTTWPTRCAASTTPMLPSRSRWCWR